jgi:hypothetical protein
VTLFDVKRLSSYPPKVRLPSVCSSDVRLSSYVQRTTYCRTLPQCTHMRDWESGGHPSMKSSRKAWDGRSPRNSKVLDLAQNSRRGMVVCYQGYRPPDLQGLERPSSGRPGPLYRDHKAHEHCSSAPLKHAPRTVLLQPMFEKRSVGNQSDLS